jgi:hypothetical protein
VTGLILIVQHKVDIIQPQPDPAGVIAISRIGLNLKAEDFAIKGECPRYIEHLYERRHSVYVQCHSQDYIAARSP